MKFSIRDLLLVTVIVALAVGWWVDRSRLAAERNRLVRLHGEMWLVHYDATATFYGSGDTSEIQVPNTSVPTTAQCLECKVRFKASTLKETVLPFRSGVVLCNG